MGWRAEIMVTKRDTNRIKVEAIFQVYFEDKIPQQLKGRGHVPRTAVPASIAKLIPGMHSMEIFYTKTNKAWYVSIEYWNEIYPRIAPYLNKGGWV
jgi:hypothetical protein